MSVSVKRSLCPDGFQKALRYSTFERIFYSCNSHSPWELLNLIGGGELWSHWGLLGGAKPAIVEDAHKSTISKGHGYVFHDLYYTYCNRIVYIYWSILHSRCTYTKNVEPRWIVFIVCEDEKCAFWCCFFRSKSFGIPYLHHLAWKRQSKSTHPFWCPETCRWEPWNDTLHDEAKQTSTRKLRSEPVAVKLVSGTRKG